MKQKNILESKIGLKLVSIGKLSKIYAWQKFLAKKHPITPEQFTVLSVLVEHDGLYQRQIAMMTMKDRPNITRIINILENTGMVERISDVEKRKVFKIRITQKGKDVYEKVLPTILEIWSSTVEGLSDEEIETTLIVLEKIKNNIGSDLNIQI